MSIHLYEHINHYYTEDPQDINDILIIDGSANIPDYSPDLSFYHTIGLAEYLCANRIYSKVIKQSNLKMAHLKLFRGFIFYQVTFTTRILHFIEKAEYFNKKIFITTAQDLLQPIPKYILEKYKNIEYINLDQDTIFIPDAIVSEARNHTQIEKQADYLFILNSSTDLGFIHKVLKHNYHFIRLKQLKIDIILNKQYKTRLFVPRQLSQFVRIITYENVKEKLNLIKQARSVIIQKNTIESLLNELECSILGVPCISTLEIRNFLEYKPNPHIPIPNLLHTYNSVYSTSSLNQEIKDKLSENVVFNVSGTVVRGGINVIYKHASTLRKHGKDVTILSDGSDENNLTQKDGEIPVVSKQIRRVKQNIDKLVATLWMTCFFVESYPDAKRKLYLVQGFETDFSPFGDPWRLLANNTYRGPFEFLTISRWCQKWLKEKYQQNAKYCPNGLNTRLFTYRPREFSGKIRILIEGSNKETYRNIDEAFTITNDLDPDKFEVWYLTYDGEPKSWYKLNKFLHHIPYEQVFEVYQSCHILLKTSFMESFSYPPLEMMATGGIAIVARNGGNTEYTIHGENCLVYEPGDIETARKYILEVVTNETLRNKLIQGGLALAQKRDWNNIEKEIITLYQ
jgi:glycosyltransferase involved in cell wall biosynthesis